MSVLSDKLEHAQKAHQVNHHAGEPSLETLMICANKLGHYAARSCQTNVNTHPIASAA